MAVGKFVHLLALRGFLEFLHLGIKVQGHVGELLLDITDNLTFGGGGERVASFVQDLHHVLGEVTASKIDTLDGAEEEEEQPEHPLDPVPYPSLLWGCDAVPLCR